VWVNAVKFENSKSRDAAGSTELDLFSMKMLSIFEIIRWLKGAASSERVMTLASSKQIVGTEVQNILDALLKKKCIKKIDDYFIALTDTIFIEDHEDLAHVKMYQMFSDFRKTHIYRKH
jgi:hypothetical protein